MLYLVLATLVMVSFSQVLRLGQKFGASVLFVGAVNYVTAAVLSLVCVIVAWKLGHHVTPPPRLTAFGAINGVLYFTHLLVLLAAYRHAGVGITAACTASGTVIPMVAAAILWSEPMTPWRWASLGLLPAAMFLLRPADKGDHPRLTLAGDLALLGTFFTNGVISTIIKAAEVDTHSQLGLTFGYQAVLFAFAAIASSGYAYLRKSPRGRPDAVTGAALGTLNVMGTLGVLLSLSVIPAVVFFPTSGCLFVIGNAIAARFLWGERLAARQVLGIAMACVIVVLVNIKPATPPVAIETPAATGFRGGASLHG